MDSDEVKRQVQELERLRAEIRWWRLGSMLAILLITVVCVATIASAVNGLVREGPRQQVFVDKVSEGFQQNVMPQVQTIASQTLTEIRPQVEAEFGKLNERAPEIAQASIKEFEILQRNLPERGEKVMTDTFGAMLKEKEPKIREMFPEATEENVAALVTNLTEVGQERVVLVNDKLFSGHMNAMNRIVEDLTFIQHAEAGNTKGMEPSWEMAILLLDLVREDLKELEPKTQPATMPGGKAAPKKKAAAVKAALDSTRKGAKI